MLLGSLESLQSFESLYKLSRCGSRRGMTFRAISNSHGFSQRPVAQRQPARVRSVALPQAGVDQSWAVG